MPLLQKITSDMRDAQKRGDSVELGTLRMLLSQLKNREIEIRTAGKELTDEEASATLAKEAKKRKESITLFTQGGRKELADKEEKELSVIYKYIPQGLSREDVERKIDALMGEEISREFSVLMRQAMARMKGMADGSMVADIIKKKIN